MQPVPPAATDCGIEDLPDEVIEYILKLVSPYADFSACARCCVQIRLKIFDFLNLKNKIAALMGISVCSMRPKSKFYDIGTKETSELSYLKKHSNLISVDQIN